MRRMTYRAAFDLHRRVLESKRPRFFHMAAQADSGLVILDAAQLRLGHAAVLIVAVVALNDPFADPVAHGQSQLRLDLTMTGETEIGHALPQQSPIRRWRLPAHRPLPERFGHGNKVRMGFVAVGACHRGHTVFAPSEANPVLIPAMAFQTDGVHRLGARILKAKDISLIATFHMLAPRTVTRLAAFFIQRSPCLPIREPMDRLLPGDEHVTMAPLAHLRADVL